MLHWYCPMPWWIPTDCPQGCGGVLLPMQSACGTWLTMTDMSATVDTAAALCGGSH